MGFLKDVLRRPRNEIPYLLLVIGHPADDCRVPEIQRLPPASYVTFLEGG